MKENEKPTGKSPRKRPPARTLEARENQMIALAVDAAEEQLRNGTASSQLITHYLKLGSTTSRIEKKILIEQEKLIRAKTEAIQSAKRVEELYKDALNAMRDYSGNNKGDEDDQDVP